MTQCPGCGAERDPGIRFCRRCGTALDEDDTATSSSWGTAAPASRPPAAGPPTEPPPGPHPWVATRTPAGTGRHGTAWYAGLAAAASVVVVAVVLGGMALAGIGPARGLIPGSDETPPAQTGAAGSTLTAGPTPPPTTAPTTVPPSPPASPLPSPPTLGNALVTVSSAAAGHAAAPQALDLLTAYFQAINNRDFARYQNLLSADVRADLDADAFATGYRSTTDSAVQLTELTDTAGGAVLARVDFTSRQDTADGPDGQTCTVWHVVMVLQPEAGRLVIGPRPPGYKATYRGC